MPLERPHGRDSAARNAPPKPRPTPVPQGRRDAAAPCAKRSRVAIRRALVPRLRRQFRSRKVPRESAAWRRFLCGIRASPLRQMADWTVELPESGEYSLEKPPCCPYRVLLCRRQAANCCFTESSFASTRLRDRRQKQFVAKQTSSFATLVIPQITKSVDVAQVNLRKHRVLSGRLRSSRLGVSCRSVNPMPEAACLHHHNWWSRQSRRHRIRQDAA